MAGTFHWVADYALEESTGYTVDIHTFESGKEQRRLKHTKPRRGWGLIFNNITWTQVQDMEAFFKLKLGGYDTFSWVNPIDNVTYTVRFSNDIFSYTRIADDVYNLQLELMEIV